MNIECYTWDVVNSNSWLVTEGEKGILFDAVENDKLFCDIQRLDELIIVLTHAHFDHIVGLNRLRSLKPSAEVLCTEKCSEYLGNTYRNMSAIAEIFMEFYKPDEQYERAIVPFVCEKAEKTFFGHKDFEWCGHRISLECVYGHSDDSLIATIDNRYMFSGDTILSIPTVTRITTGSTKKFWTEDMPKILKMKVDRVYPGHGPDGGLEEMIKVNSIPGKYKELVWKE